VGGGRKQGRITVGGLKEAKRRKCAIQEIYKKGGLRSSSKKTKMSRRRESPKK